MQCQQVKGPAVSLGKIAPAARPTWPGPTCSRPRSKER